MPKQTELIHCPSCGEDYAPTYRRCPFCNAKAPKKAPEEEEYQDGYDDQVAPDYDPDYDQDYDDEPRRGGKRLPSGGHFWDDLPWRWILCALIAIAIVVLVVLFILKVWPKLAQTGVVPSETPSHAAESLPPSQAPSALPSTVPTEAPSALPSETPDPFLELPDPTEPVTSEAPAVSTPAPVASPQLNHTDFTISQRYPDPVRLTVSGGTAASWKSGNEGVVTVSASGLVTAVGNGNTTVTCTLDTGATLTCAVHVNGFSAAGASEAPAASQTPAPEAPAAAAKLNHTDFMIDNTYPDPVQLRVIGGTASYWSSKNESVATVSQTGLVTAAGNGYTKVSCTLDDGTVLSCDVWVELK